MAEFTKEEAYWRENHPEQSYPGKTSYDDYAAAYRTGYEGFHKYPGKPYEEIEDDLALDYQRTQAGAALPWDHARHAVRAAWAKLSQDVTPRDPRSRNSRRHLVESNLRGRSIFAAKVRGDRSAKSRPTEGCS